MTSHMAAKTQQVTITWMKQIVDDMEYVGLDRLWHGEAEVTVGGRKW